MTAVTGARRGAGRPEVTSHAEIEAAAFRLFAERGFAQTTLDAIAEEVGVSRRTLFRYYASKNDIPWGQFGRTLDDFRTVLRSVPEETPVYEAVHRGVLEFNRFPVEALAGHRERMHLILTTPELQAHSVLQYAEWRAVIAEYVAGRYRLPPSHLLPQTVGRVSLALALAAYDAWLDNSQADLLLLLDQAMTGLRDYLTSDRPTSLEGGL